MTHRPLRSAANNYSQTINPCCSLPYFQAQCSLTELIVQPSSACIIHSETFPGAGNTLSLVFTSEMVVSRLNRKGPLNVSGSLQFTR